MSANNEEADDLVREVIEENPPEEQGIRPEWQEHVGWGRKEDIRNLRGGQQVVDATTTEEFNQSDYSAKAVGGQQYEIADRSLPGRLDQSLNVVLAVLLPVVTALFAVYYYCSSKKLCGTKPRKTEAHLV